MSANELRHSTHGTDHRWAQTSYPWYWSPMSSNKLPMVLINNELRHSTHGTDHRWAQKSYPYCWSPLSSNKVPMVLITDELKQGTHGTDHTNELGQISISSQWAVSKLNLHCKQSKRCQRWYILNLIKGILHSKFRHILVNILKPQGKFSTWYLQLWGINTKKVMGIDLVFFTWHEMSCQRVGFDRVSCVQVFVR